MYLVFCCCVDPRPQSSYLTRLFDKLSQHIYLGQTRCMNTKSCCGHFWEPRLAHKSQIFPKVVTFVFVKPGCKFHSWAQPRTQGSMCKLQWVIRHKNDGNRCGKLELGGVWKKDVSNPIYFECRPASRSDAKRHNRQSTALVSDSGTVCSSL